MIEIPFGPEAGRANPAAFSHVQMPALRREAAPGPSGSGDVRSQRAGGAGALAVLAEAPVGEGVGAVAGGGVSPGAAAGAPGLVGDTGNAQASAVAPAVGAVGVHFVGGVPAQGLASSQSPTGAPAGYAGTSGPGLVAGSGFVGAGGALAGLANAGVYNALPAQGISGGRTTFQQ